jgi:hypothetical protein
MKNDRFFTYFYKKINRTPAVVLIYNIFFYSLACLITSITKCSSCQRHTLFVQVGGASHSPLARFCTNVLNLTNFIIMLIAFYIFFVNLAYTCNLAIMIFSFIRVQTKSYFRSYIDVTWGLTLGGAKYMTWFFVAFVYGNLVSVRELLNLIFLIYIENFVITSYEILSHYF